MTAEQHQLERIAAALGTTPAALVAVRPTLLELAAEQFERRMAAIAAGRHGSAVVARAAVSLRCYCKAPGVDSGAF